MKRLLFTLNFISVVLLFMACLGNSGVSPKEDKINYADTIYLGDLCDKFKDDLVFFETVAPDLMLVQYQYCWTITQTEALEKGLSKEYYEKVKQEISATNEAIRRGIMKGANKNKIFDFQDIGK